MTTDSMQIWMSKYNQYTLFSIIESLHNGGKMNSLARSNASIYGNKEDLYDRLKRHAYPGKKGDV